MSQPDPVVTAEVSLYPLKSEVEPPVIAFIQALRAEPGVEVVTNAMSTQVRGRFSRVHAALGRCTAEAMVGPDSVVLVTKLLNRDLAIGETPDLG